MSSTKGFKIGFRYLSFFELNAYQTPKATSVTVPYEGIHYESARALTINYPQPRKIEHQGDDRVEALDYLPPSTAMDAEIHVGMADLSVTAILSGIKVATIGTSKFMSLATDQQGLEPFVGRLARKAVYKSPADIENIIKEAALIATRSGRDIIRLDDISEAIERVDMGMKHKRTMQPLEREMVAYHESGHLIVL